MFSVFLLAAFTKLPSVAAHFRVRKYRYFVIFYFALGQRGDNTAAAMVLGIDRRSSMIFFMNFCSAIGSYRV